MKKLVVYYSFSGNTKQIAKMIQKATGSNLAMIETLEPYPEDMDKLLEVAKNEVSEHHQPKIKDLNLNWASYDEVIIGTPTWWYTMAPAVSTFLNMYDFKGKEVSFFQTHGGEEGHTIDDMKKSCANASFKSSLSIYFDYYNKNKLLTPLSQIEQWIKKL